MFLGEIFQTQTQIIDGLPDLGQKILLYYQENLLTERNFKTKSTGRLDEESGLNLMEEKNQNSAEEIKDGRLSNFRKYVILENEFIFFIFFTFRLFEAYFYLLKLLFI